MNRTFVLGAGLGTRLRPLTHRLPKPLLPLFHRPLIEWTLESCAAAGAARFAVNTHHLPEAWATLGAAAGPCGIVALNGVPETCMIWNGKPLSLFHEPILLETGGGLKNLSPWLGDEPVLIHNGDVYSTLPLERLIAAHQASGLPATLALRSEGPAKHILPHADGTLVADIRNHLGRGEGTHLFTGIYCVNPEFLELLPAGEKTSVIPAFLELARQGRLGAVVLDEGIWLDLGDRSSYLEAHRTLRLAPDIHPDAEISPSAVVEHSVIGPGASLGAGAVVRNSVVWPGGTVAAHARLDHCIVYSADPVSGSHRGEDL